MSDSKRKTTKKSTNKRADATKNYLSNSYGLDANTETERILGLVSQSVNPFEFVGSTVTDNPDMEFYCGNGDDRMGLERAKRQGWKVLDGEHDVELQAGSKPHHVYMYRPKSVGERVRHAEDQARAADQGIAYETEYRSERVQVELGGDPYTD